MRNAPANNDHNPCESVIRNAIAQSGMIGIGEYMAQCLTGDGGYYRRTHDPIGTGGDFITAPEISQIFGELIGLWAVDQWQKSSAPKPWHLCEFGPGRGTLMADAIRAAGRAGQMTDAGRIYLLESNPHLRKMQAEKLPAGKPVWINHIDDLPPEPVVFISNEFFDAMPVEQIIFRQNNWHSRGVGIDAANGNLEWTSDPSAFDTRAIADIMPPISTRSGDIFEYSPISKIIVQSMTRHIQSYGGAAVIIDYGHTAPGYGSTLQAVKQHQYADPLQQPGLVDLTCHVDFHALGQYADMAGLTPQWMGTQGQFLIALGLEMRLQQLLAKCGDAQKQTLIDGAKRLTDPDQMGSLFKVMILSAAS